MKHLLSGKAAFLGFLAFCALVSAADILLTFTNRETIHADEKNSLMLFLMTNLGLSGAMIVRGAAAVITVVAVYVLFLHRPRIAWFLASVWTVQQVCLVGCFLYITPVIERGANSATSFKTDSHWKGKLDATGKVLRR